MTSRQQFSCRQRHLAAWIVDRLVIYCQNMDRRAICRSKVAKRLKWHDRCCFPNIKTWVRRSWVHIQLHTSWILMQRFLLLWSRTISLNIRPDGSRPCRNLSAVKLLSFTDAYVLNVLLNEYNVHPFAIGRLPYLFSQSKISKTYFKTQRKIMEP